MQHNQTKVSLSKFELQLVTNAQILLTKNQIIEKVYHMFGELSEQYSKSFDGFFAPVEHQPSAKISRGENYEGLPYVMLDYPRRFTKQDTFGIRTFFWWGNFFSITLQLSGQSHHQYSDNLVAAGQKLQADAWYVGVNENMWQHHFRNDNYQLLNNTDLRTFLHGIDGIKLAKKIPLQEWDNSFNFLDESFRFLMSVLKP